MSKQTQFQVRINGGPEQTFHARTGVYTLAALAALAMLEYERHPEYDVVKIWVPSLVEAGYGPYFVAFDGHKVGVPISDRRF